MVRKRVEGKRGQNDGSARERPNGRWEWRASIGGEQRSFYGATRDEARALADTAVSEHAAGVRTNAGKERIEDYLRRWLLAADIRPKTRAGYHTYITQHLNPGIGRTRLADLTADQVQRLVAAKRATLAPASIRQMHAILRKALNDAVDDGLISKNPALRARLPRVPHVEIAALSEYDAQALLAALRGDRLEALYTVALAMGLRLGEALGLWWECVDLANRTITVKRQLQRVGGEWLFTEPKSPQSRRTLPIPAAAVPVLQRHWEAQQREQYRDPHPAPLVFRSAAGQPLHSASVTHHFQRATLLKAGLGHMRFHDLRHGCATLLIARGVHPRVVMEILGHSQISLAMNTYGHVGRAVQRAAMDEMDAALTAPTMGHSRPG